MLTFLFWNLHERLLQQHIAHLVQEHNVDVLMFAECVIPEASMLDSLNTGSARQFHFSPVPVPQVGRDDRKLRVYHSLAVDDVAPVWDSNIRYLTVRRVRGYSGADILMALMHLPILFRLEI